MSVEQEIENLLHEQRRFAPTEDFVASAVARPELYDKAKGCDLGWLAVLGDESWRSKPQPH
ncbi:MAG TPA: hypothetical protein VIB80_03495, partial [Aquiluna sp.]